MRVLICGGGVIGAAIAYFLSRRGVEAVVIERTGLACAASGKSGGFLALDWCDGTPLAPLARRSFALHDELARTVDDAWGYRRLTTYGGFAEAAGAAPAARRDGDVAWLSADVQVTRRLGSAQTTAQVDPGAFTAALMRAAEAHGATLRRGQVTGLLRGAQAARVDGVMVDDAPVPGDAVVIALGPWSILATQWLTLPAVFGLKGHSLVFETGAQVPAQALFLDLQEADGTALAPELFPRADGTTYVCAISSEAPLPLDPAAVAPDAGAIERLEAICGRLSPVLGQAPIRARQACYRPVTRDGLPLIGRVPGIANAYVATGHSVWGILNAPATGEAMADLITTGAAVAVDLRPFDPARLRPFDPARLRLGER
ncbi:FAD-dependent oxidoreductase [Vineibacter terrae]|uniref:NAD(P)/FAD-dependent oxidoreductase n=1 Tax=Vineibacter terrae TaxID=2586908 RepID=UPI002E32EB3D|nr:FAD-dependent oxidoreductase [Vineibacter terrae]HEX2886857.1 FAD-dependent oxidoreductase [Vineibacter terrae]